MDADKLKDFLLYNFEKFIVVVVIGLAGFLVYSGWDREDITEKIQPDKLKERAVAVKNEVENDDHSEAVIEGRAPEFIIDDQLAKNRKDLDFATYDNPEFNGFWEKPISFSNIKRTDPTIAKPKSVLVKNAIYTIAVRSTREDYPIASLEAAEALEIEEKRPERTSRSRSSRGGRGGAGEMDEEMEMEMGGMEDYGDEMMEMGGMGMGMGGEAGGGGNRRMSPDYDEGFRPTAKPRFSQPEVQDNPVPKLAYFIAGTALVPHKEIAESYKKALAEATDVYDPRRRDQPKYVNFEVQRADVTDKSVDELVEADWVARADKLQTTFDAATWWCGTAPEVVPADYRAPGFTMWIPPILLDDYKHLVTHPDIPMKSKRELDAAKDDAANDDTPVDVNIDDVVSATDGSGGGGPGMSGYGGGMDMDMDEMEMEMGMGGSFGGPSTMAIETDPVEYKLIRFYDFAYAQLPRFRASNWRDPNEPKRGRKYVYRVRFAVNDPNFPSDKSLQPPGRSLAPEVYQRVTALDAKAVQENGKRDFNLWSEWSEPSAPASLPALNRFYVGDVKEVKTRRANIGGRTVIVESKPPVAEVVTSSFAPGLGVFVPMRMDVTEGSILSVEADEEKGADVVDPITLEVKKLPNAKIQSDAIVIDIDGGVELDILKDADDMFEPGLFLMMDGQGNLELRDSLSDQKAYRIKSWAKERGK